MKLWISEARLARLADAHLMACGLNRGASERLSRTALNALIREGCLWASGLGSGRAVREHQDEAVAYVRHSNQDRRRQRESGESDTYAVGRPAR